MDPPWFFCPILSSRLHAFTSGHFTDQLHFCVSVSVVPLVLFGIEQPRPSEEEVAAQKSHLSPTDVRKATSAPLMSAPRGAGELQSSDCDVNAVLNTDGLCFSQHLELVAVEATTPIITQLLQWSNFRVLPGEEQLAL